MDRRDLSEEDRKAGYSLKHAFTAGRRDMIKRVNNIPLKQKMLSIMLIGLSIMAIMSFLIIQILSSSYNKMLYQSMAESMSYSAKDITDYLNKMENLTELFLSDEKIQKNMTSLKSGYEKGVIQSDALRNMGIYVGEYYYNYSDGILKYISLYTPASVLKTNLIAADKIPEEIQKQLLLASDKKDGAPCWVDEYMDEYGLFLARNIRQIESLKLTTLGTIVLNVDMNALMKSSTRFEKQYGKSMYIILSEGDILYHTENLAMENIEKLSLRDIDKYSIKDIGENSYFISHGTIPEFDWNYYCLVSYEDINQKINRIRRICFWITILDFMVAIWLAAQLTGKLMVHISGLKNRMQQFARDNTQVPETEYDYSTRGDELGTLNLQFDEMSETIIRLIQENYISELLKKEAQIKAMESQINPHFLYNTLDSIKWRAKSIGEKNISDMVEALGILLRTSLSNKNEKNYTVGREMEIVFSYITIQKLRYESRLHFKNDICETWYSFVIPKLVIQPLIENAIFYGLEMDVGECYILLSARKEQDSLHFYIKNTGSEMEENLLEKLVKEEVKPHGHGVGLLNIDKRVKMQYGETYGLRLYNDNEYAVAELVIPIEGGD